MEITTLIIIVIGVIVLILLAVWFLYTRKAGRNGDQLFEDMEGREFEEYCSELLASKGYDNIEMTPASHDYGIDILADRDGISYAIQCKCYSDPVGIKAIQEAYAGKDYYNAMIGVVMTNQDFTRPAREFADKLNILLWDGDYVVNMIREVALPEKKEK